MEAAQPMTTTTPPPTETLDQALSRVWEHDWRHRRSGPTLRSQAEIALAALAGYANAPWTAQGVSPPPLTAERVDHTAIRPMTAAWYKEGLAPATIQKRLTCLSKLGVNVEGCRVKVPKSLKWYLKESDRPKLLAWFRLHGNELAADFIDWTTRTGLRVEETLRLTWGDITEEGVSVPGLKTSTSQATLPLGSEARNVLARVHCDAYERPAANSEAVFKTDYEELQGWWGEARAHFGWSSDPTATLKALRRSAARYLHIDCGMPLHMVQQYLRHESMDTTLEYLRLTGGYGTEEMRRYLK